MVGGRRNERGLGKRYHGFLINALHRSPYERRTGEEPGTVLRPSCEWRLRSLRSHGRVDSLSRWSRQTAKSAIERLASLAVHLRITASLRPGGERRSPRGDRGRLARAVPCFALAYLHDRRSGVQKMRGKPRLCWRRPWPLPFMPFMPFMHFVQFIQVHIAVDKWRREAIREKRAGPYLPRELLRLPRLDFDRPISAEK